MGNIPERPHPEYGERGVSDGYSLPLPVSPQEALAKILELRDLLHGETEFETRYPEAYQLLFTPPHKDAAPGHHEPGGLPLPSFGIRIRRDAPTGHADLTDAYSTTAEPGLLEHELALPELRQSWSRIDPAYMRGILLAILGREEYSERIRPGILVDTQEGVYEGRYSVRITDLRLAQELPLETLTDLLTPLFDSLERPLKSDTVVSWKRQQMTHTVAEQARSDRGASKFPSLKKKAISFAAAALFLFIDLDMPDIGSSPSRRLAEQVTALAEEIKKSGGRIQRGAEKLVTLVSSRGSGKRKRLDREYYLALGEYRMGRSLKDIAEMLDITPWDSGDAVGTKNWKANVKEKIARGKRIEGERFPEEAAVFGSTHPHTRGKARFAYRAFIEEREKLKVRQRAQAAPDKAFEELAKALGIFAAAERLGTNLAENPGSMGIVEAYIQLGCCLDRKIPLP